MIVYSFGKTLSHIITGKEPSMNESFKRDNHSLDSLFQIYDHCVQPNPINRPTSQDLLTQLILKMNQ
jgi:serine/threonine protein kinase